MNPRMRSLSNDFQSHQIKDIYILKFLSRAGGFGKIYWQACGKNAPLLMAILPPSISAGTGTASHIFERRMLLALKARSCIIYRHSFFLPSVPSKGAKAVVVCLQTLNELVVFLRSTRGHCCFEDLLSPTLKTLQM